MNPGGLKQQSNLRRGALFVIASSVMFAFLGAAIKIVSAHVPLEMVVFFRNFFGLLALSPWLFRLGKSGLQTQRLPLHALRACFGLAAMYCFFYALAHLQLVEAMLLNFSAPFFIPIFALLWLRETLPPSVPWALGVGLLGITLILKPGIGILTPVALIGLISGVFAALAMVSVRSMVSTEPPERIVFYFSAMGTLVSGLPLLWSWHTPDLGQWGILLGIGVLATGGQVLLTRGITNAPAGQVGPFSYSTVVFATLLGWVAWGEMLDLVSLLGGLLVCAAGVLVLRGERTAGTMVSPRY